MDQLRNLLKQSRLEQNISIDDLAETLQVAPETLVSFEADGTLEADVIFGLVNLLNIPPEVVQPILDQIGWNITDEEHIERLVSGGR